MLDTQDLTLEELERTGSVQKLHAAVEAAIASGDTAETDRLLAIWSKYTRRRRSLTSLQAAAHAEIEPHVAELGARKPIEDMSDEEVCAELERLVGRSFTIRR